MAKLNNKFLFFTTSPRTPAKMIPEIQLLCEKFSGKKWDKENQREFSRCLKFSPFFKGETSKKESDFSARDRITRAPKSLGFVNLEPCIELTEAGQALLSGKRIQEVFLRQLLKFQLPSPYHTKNEKNTETFYVKPYLEIMRLVYELEYLTFDELKIFAIQITDYHKYEDVKAKIIHFRQEKEQHKGEYKRFVNEIWTNTVLEIYSEEIAAGETKTRETKDTGIVKFVKTKKGTMRDYADACFRYIRYTELFVFSGHSICVAEDKVKDVKYILSSIDRNPVFINDVNQYKSYMFSANKPVLYADNKDNLVEFIMSISDHTKQELNDLDIESLKDLRDEIIAYNKESIIHEQVAEIKSYALYSEIINTFNGIVSKEYYDAPLMFEYNTWRAMTMLDGGDIKGNFKFDDMGGPISTASGNMPDIECDYDEYSLSVEVTLQSGQRQYETEGEPVARHYGQLKKKSGKDTYCLFIAPKINEATLAHFYGLNHLPIALYGGKSKIVPLELNQFIHLVKNSYNYRTQPTPADVRRFLDLAIEQGEMATDENDWKVRIQNCIETWLVS